MEDRSGFGYFLLGLGIGVAAGMLWAPRAGEETRQFLADRAGDSADYLKNRTQEGKDYIRQRTEDIKGSASDIYERGRSSIHKQKDTLNAAIDAGKQAYREAVGNVKTAASDAIEQATDNA